MGSSFTRVTGVVSVVATLMLGVACGARTPLLDGLDVSSIVSTDGGVRVDGSSVALDASTKDASPSDAGAPACGACNIGETECDDGGLSSCIADKGGCGEWGASVPCSAVQTSAGALGSASCRVVDVRAPRQIAPLSTSTVTTRRPRLQWTLAGQDDGALIEVCRDRACGSIVNSFTTLGTSGTPTTSLDPGTYFWRARGTEGSFLSNDTSAVWQFTVPARDTPQNTSWGTTFDGNGDGFADVVVGAQVAADGAGGAAYVYMGSANGLVTTPTLLENPTNSVSAVVVSAGDVNGDGFADLAVGSPDAKGGAGLLLLYLGSANGPVSPPTIISSPKGHFAFGGCVEGAGDVNGDGYGDLFVCDVDGTDAADVFVFLGGPNGLSSTAATSLRGGILVGITASSDVNGDGFPDVVVATSGKMGSNEGSVELYLGSAAGLSTTASSTFTFQTTGSTNFFVVDLTDAGDVNGDGFGDVLVGTEDVGNGTVTLLLGSANGLVQSTTIPNPAFGIFGDRLSGARDIDQDGFDDVIVGVPGNPGQIVYVYFGSAKGLSTSPVVLTSPPGNTTSFGDPVAGGGDIDGDGFDDILVGGWSNVGAVWVFSGGKDRLTKPPLMLSSPTNADGFSETLAE